MGQGVVGVKGMGGRGVASGRRGWVAVDAVHVCVWFEGSCVYVVGMMVWFGAGGWGFS